MRFIYFLILILFYNNAFSQNNIGNTPMTSNNIEIAEKDTQPTSETVTVIVLSLTGDTLKEVGLNEEIRLFIKGGDENLKWNKVYLNNLHIDELKADAHSRGWYTFKLKETIGENPLKQIFGITNKDRFTANLWIGSNLNERIDAGEFTVIVDPHQKMRWWFSWLPIGLITVIIGFVLIKNDLTVLRDQSTLGAGAPFSLSRTQFAYWTLIILFSYFYVWIFNGFIIEITGDVLTLIGISAGTTFGGKLLDQKDLTNKEILKRHQDENSSKSFLLNILSDNSGVSVHRLQNVAFTIAISSYFLYEVMLNGEIPELDNGFLALMGISSGAYLAMKSGENSRATQNAVG